MESANTLKIQKISEWNRLLNVKTSDIFKGLLGIVEGILNGELGTAARAGVEMLMGIGSEMNDELPRRAYVLMYGAIRQGMMKLVTDSAPTIRKYNSGISYDAVAFQKMVDALDTTFENNLLSIDETFFEKPDQHELFLLIQPIFRTWLLGINLPDHAVNPIANRLDYYYVQKLDDLLAEKSEYFADLKQNVERSPAQRRIWARYLYDQSIIAEWKAGIFQESFGLSDIHVSLHGCYPIGPIKKDWKENRIHKVTDAEEHIWDRLHRPIDPKVSKSRLTVLRGGPGSGKSSLMKKIAWRLAQQGGTSKRPFYMISLVKFDVELGIKAAIEKFIKEDGHLRGKEDPCDPDLADGYLKPIFIFDGLDELSRSGKSGEQLAKELVSGILDYLKDQSDSSGRRDFRAIVTGRDLIVQQVTEMNFHEEGQILELLPMYLVKREEEWRGYMFQDTHKLLDEDLRLVWWKQFWDAKDPSQQGLPEILKQEEYESLSGQPLLSYLLARAYLKGDLNEGEHQNTNTVYASLVQDVGIREWGTHQHTDLKPENYERLLQALAMVAWQSGDVRATTTANFENRCQRPELKVLMDSFRINKAASPTDLMTSFFTRKLGKDEELDALIEFTHKSFGEYLVALEYLVVVNEVVAEYSRGKLHSMGNAMREWMEAMSMATMSEEIWLFLHRQLMLDFGDKVSDVEKIQKTLATLFTDFIHNGFPTAAYQTSIQVETASRIAQTNLLLMLSALSTISGQNTKVGWNLNDHAEPRNVMSILLRGEGELLLRRGLNRLVIPESAVGFNIFAPYMDLWGADLDYVNLNNAYLSFADLTEADLRSACLNEANLRDATLRDANLQHADLRGANLERANLEGANLQHADLEDADLQGASLGHANLKNANLQGATIYPFRLKDWLDGQEAYNYLISQGALNVPKPEGIE